MRRTIPLTLALLAATGLAACGSTRTVTRTVTRPAPAAQLSACPPGASHIGCSITAPKGRALTAPATVGGCKIPDVYEGNGLVNWTAAKAWGICGGIAKAGEYVQDSLFDRNWSTLRSLHLWHAPYWFVRNTGCTHEASEIEAVLDSVGYAHDPLAGPVMLDMEVPEASGYAPCLAGALHAHYGTWPDIYTSPGSWPGGPADGLPLWMAEFGPNPDLCSRLWTCHLQAWQFAAPPWVYYYIPGMGYGDVSVDLGITRQLQAPAPPPPARLKCFGPARQLQNPVCVRIRPLVARWSRARDSTSAALARNGCDKRRSSGLCGLLRQRYGWFSGQVIHALSTH